MSSVSNNPFAPDLLSQKTETVSQGNEGVSEREKSVASPLGTLVSALGELGEYAPAEIIPVGIRPIVSGEEWQKFRVDLEASALYQNAQEEFFPQALLEEAFWSIMGSRDALATMKNHRLDIAEATAIVAFTHLGPESRSVSINQNIREENPKVEIFVLYLRQGLEKLPPHKGTIYRCAELSENLGLQYQIGACVTERGICATSTLPIFDSRKYLPIEMRLEALMEGSDLANCANYHVIIHPKPSVSSARDVSAFSKDHGGCVLFPPNTTFRVLEREWIGDPLRSTQHPALSSSMFHPPQGIIKLTVEEVD